MILNAQTIRVAIIGARDASQAGIDFAFGVGKLLAERGVLVYTGGGSGIMEAASKGVHEGGGIAVGVLKEADGKDANKYIHIPIMTGMGDLRNGILIRSVHGAIAIEGAYGTLSEIAYTLGYEKPVLGYKSWDIPGIRSVNSPKEAVDSMLKMIGDTNT
ncbi:MAG: TIGR00725 family protein [Candidatus Marinimicrobia bacterium]|nr:TIGR00725 family protein [Candidatus Neomarinimicrobiota bacterium]